MKTMRQATFAVTLAAMAAMVAACTSDDAEVQDDAMEAEPAAMQHDAESAPELSAEDMVAVEEIRRVADGFRDLEDARAAGYTVQFPEGCIQTPEGSQGFHYMNESLVDDRVALDRPELVMYEPQADGSMVLIGVDYIIPFDQWTAEEPPRVLDRPMMRNEAYEVWALHVWTHRENPSGMFAAFNPAASCDHAEAARL